MFFTELDRLEFTEGKNLLVERYSGEGRSDEYAELAKVVVSRRPDLIITSTVRMIEHFKAATSSIPIVALTSDPIAFGVTSQSRETRWQHNWRDP
jgi:putative ABC transport system substrate-binding protein